MYSCQKISSIKTYIIPVIALFLSSFVIYLVEKYEKFISKVICIIGKRSLEIYLLHRFVIIIARLMFKNVFNIFLTVTLVTIIGVIAPMIIKKICVKIRIDKILFNPYSLIAKQKWIGRRRRIVCQTSCFFIISLLAYRYYRKIERINLDYSRHSRETGWKPHIYFILTEYCFSPIKWMKKRASTCDFSDCTNSRTCSQYMGIV